MFKVIGGAVVYGFALFGLSVLLAKRSKEAYQGVRRTRVLKSAQDGRFSTAY